MSAEALTLAVDSFNLTLDLPGPVRAGAKRYTPRFINRETDRHRKAQVILLFAHALGYHKEHWEPVIQELFQEDHAMGGVLVKEAWVIDCPDHGESAILNEAVLEHGKRYISCYEYGDAFINLIRSGLLDQRCKLIFVGHSAGGVSGILTAVPPKSNSHPQSDTTTTNPYDSMILVEPAIISRALLAADKGVQKVVAHLIKSSSSRRDIWPSLAEAKSWLAEKSPWNLWDPRVLDISVEYGMRPLPTRIYPDVKTGVTLSYPRVTHGLAYGNLEDQHDGVDQLRVLCRPDSNFKVSIIFGRRIDFNPKAVQDELKDIVEGSRFGTVSYLEGLGHLIIQEDPTQVAKAMYKVLRDDYGTVSSKL